MKWMIKKSEQGKTILWPYGRVTIVVGKWNFR